MIDVTRRQAFEMAASGMAAGYCYLAHLERSDKSQMAFKKGLDQNTDRFTFTPGQGWRQAEETTERK